MSTRAASPHDFVRPLAIASLLVCAALLLWFLAQALLAWPLAASTPWQLLVGLAGEQAWPASLQWLLQHPVATSLWLAAACVPSLLASWGLYRQRSWGLWGYVVMLVVSGLANLAVAGWLDTTLAALVACIGDPAFQKEMHGQRLLMALTLYGGSVALLVLQLWLAWRLLRPDIRTRFQRAAP